MTYYFDEAGQYLGCDDRREPPMPDPCEGCSYIFGGLTWCSGHCLGLKSFADVDEQIRRIYYALPGGR